MYESLARIRIKKSTDAFRKRRVSKASSPSVYYLWRTFAREFEYLERSEFLVCDAERLPFRDSKFDGPTCTAVMEHLRNPEALVEETARVLGSGSIAAFSTVNGLATKLVSTMFGRLRAFVRPKTITADEEER